MGTFEDILNKPIDAIEAPKPIPPGTYLAMISGQPEYKKAGANQTDLVEFPVKLVQPMEDVDVAALNESLSRADGNNKSLGELKFVITQWLTEDALFMTKSFLKDHLGIDSTGTLGQMIPEAMGKQVLVTIKHELTKGDNPRVLARIRGTAKV